MTDSAFELDEPDFESAVENPALAAAAAAFVNDERPPDLEVPLDGPVVLPGGFRRIKVGTGATESVTQAWVRELNGEDEEHIGKARLKGDTNSFVNAILEAGVEKLGKTAPEQDELEGLLVGDRDYLLLEISRATYGDELEFEDFICYHCDRTISFTVHKGEDIPVRRLDHPDEADFEVELRRGRKALVRLPSGTEQALIADAETQAEANTVLLANCVQSIDGNFVGGDLAAARALGMKDRQKILEEMGKRMPGPQYNEVRFTHPDCGKEVRLTVTLADLFLGL